MFHVRYLSYLILLHLITAAPQINLYYTDRVSEFALQHDCLRVVVDIDEGNVSREIISYCMSESSSQFNVQKNDLFPNFTFAELSQKNINSEQLYQWSAPIDLIEDYQFYLNQLSTSNDSSLETQVFYNCTLPRFGPVCQYEFTYHHPNHSSLYEIIAAGLYRPYKYKSPNMTCYKHLQCNRGPFPSCLDWSEICNGKQDCLDGEDEGEHCWQIEINQCKDNEYQCYNGQCIQQAFFRDDQNIPDCLDGSDEPRGSDYERSLLLKRALFSIKDNSVSDDCWSALKCQIDGELFHSSFCYDLCHNNTCFRTIERTCPDMLYIPAIPVLFGHIYFAYRKNSSRLLKDESFDYPYVCYNNSRYDAYFVNASKILFNNTMCYYRSLVFSDPYGQGAWNRQYLSRLDRGLWEYNQIWKYNQTFDYFLKICNRSNMYQCASSLKCISTSRLMDNVDDCPHDDDENRTERDTILSQEAEEIDSDMHGTEEIIVKVRYARRTISFQTICDGFVDLRPVPINGQNETDETECEQWQCDNIYTRCNGQWNCLNGADELGCGLSIPLNYSSDHHMCVSPYTNQLIYLPVEKANDGKVDCIGGTDEPTLCRKKYRLRHTRNVYCNTTHNGPCFQSLYLCDNYSDCTHNDDERFCTVFPTSFSLAGICVLAELLFASDTEKFLCERTKEWLRQPILYFSIDEMSKSVENPEMTVKNPMLSRSSVLQMSDQHQVRCHLGLNLRVWLNNENNLPTTTCLCPPTYYGARCEYQNQRISLGIRFRTLSDSWQIPFRIIVLLIDNSDERIIHSYEQFTYLSGRDCQMKFNIYLLYSTRTKNPTKNYSIHMDIYEKSLLTHRGSLLFPITFSFLPVHRLALIVDIPQSNNNTQSCSTNECVHGKCIRYSNTPENLTFCQCKQGWAGRFCNITSTCMCASDSLYIGVAANNRSICVCPMNRFGPRCLFVDSVCQTNNNSICQNNGQCLVSDDYMVSKQKFTCICPKGFIGDRCELVENKLVLSFANNFLFSQSIFIHFIEVITNNTPVRGTTFRTLPLRQDSVIIHWAQPFHLVFIELLNKTYYLAVVQKTYNQSRTLIKMINSSDRCPHIRDVFNESFSQLHLLRRIKYYHLACQQQSLNLSCFHDDVHLCLCYDHRQRRLANCFEFKHNITFDCLGQSACQNGAQCVQDKPDCPTRSICICPPCFYGGHCQFSTSGFGLSLDAILGYHILPHLSLTRQPVIIQISSALTIIFIIAGLINGVLALITFKNKSVREVGCGFYLLGSSITTLLTTVMFGLKFWILIVAQMTAISNRLFLSFQCHSIDFLLRVCLNMDQWLNACVAMERTITVTKGARFNKKKSRQAAKRVILILLIFIIATSIHDPVYRKLIDEENDANDNEKKIWCIITYPSGVQMFNSAMNIFHFSGPFLINLISAIILVTKKSRQQTTIQTHRTDKEILREQLRQHRQLFTAPVILVILAVPRLIISFVSKCMNSAGDSWLFLVGYFISFIPPMLTFIVFILPSKFYKKEFRKTVVQYRTTVQRRLHLIS